MRVARASRTLSRMAPLAVEGDRTDLWIRSQCAGRPRGERGKSPPSAFLHDTAASSARRRSELQTRAKRGRVAMTVCIASDNVLVSYRIRRCSLIHPKSLVKSASCFRGCRHPADRRTTFREVPNTCFYVLPAARAASALGIPFAFDSNNNSVRGLLHRSTLIVP